MDNVNHGDLETMLDPLRQQIAEAIAPSGECGGGIAPHLADIALHLANIAPRVADKCGGSIPTAPVDTGERTTDVKAYFICA